MTELFFSDSDAQLVPYNRGPLYFALLDQRMRQASGGTKRVDDLIFRFIEEQGSAEDPVKFWRAILVDELGETGGAEFDAMMKGAPLDLTPDLFGPCITGEMTDLQTFARGFRPYLDDDGQTRIGPVVPGSPAELAGLQRYDIILNPDDLEAVETGTTGTPVSLDIQRENTSFSAEYVPWTRPSPGLQWELRDVDPETCDL